MANDTSKSKFLLDVSVQGLQTKQKVFVQFFDLELIESVRLRKLPNGENITEIDFLRENASRSQKQNLAGSFC